MHRFKLDFKSFQSLRHSMQPVQWYIHISKMKIEGGGWQQNDNFKKISYGSVSAAAGWIELLFPSVHW